MLKKTLLFLFCGVAGLTSNEYCSSPTVSDIADQNAYGYWQGRVGSASVCSGFFADVSFLYVKPEVERLSYGQKLNINPPTSPTGRIEVKSSPQGLDFNWEPGLSVGIGYILPNREQWQVSGYWTYLHSDADGKFEKPRSDSLYLNPSWLPLLMGTVANKASADWSLNFNVLDISISRATFIGKWFSIEPKAGFRAAWIDQNYSVKYGSGFVIDTLGVQQTIEGNTKFKASNDYTGFGTRIGSNLEWHLSKNLSIAGKFFASLLYGTFDIDEEYDGALVLDFGGGPQLVREIITFQKNFNALRPVLETELGVKWQYFFNEETQRIQLGAFYQLNIWNDQNETVNEFISRDSTPINGTTNNASSLFTELNPRGNLTIQGLRVEARLDF